MLRKMAVVVCSAGVIALTSGYAAAQAAGTAKEKTQSTAHKAGAAVSDAAITTAVKTKFAANKTVSATDINVDTADGVVTLTGKVHSAAERSAALRIARQTKGVKRVENKLTLDTAGTTGKDEDTEVKVKDDTTAQSDEKAKIVIKDDTTPKVKAAGRKTADATITATVKTKLSTVKGVIANDINVDTDEGVVTLKGTVPDEAQKTKAEDVARHTAGVKRVVNELTVKQ